MQDPSIQKAKPIKPRYIISEKSTEKQLAGCAERWVNDADYRKCMQANSRTYGTIESLDSRKQTSENQPNDTAAKAGAVRKSVVHCSHHSQRIPTRQHPQLGQAHRARMDCNSTQRVTVSKTESSSQKVIKNLAI